MRKHTAEKFFECHCGAVLKSKLGLKRHQKIHGEKVIDCKVCQKPFFSMSLFNTHWKNVHLKTHGILKNSEREYFLLQAKFGTPFIKTYFYYQQLF